MKMKILVINAGSSSLKYQLIDMEDKKVLAKGLCERIGIEGSRLTHTPAGGEKVVIEKPMKDHSDAIRMVIDALVDSAFLVHRTGNTDADTDDLILADLLALQIAVHGSCDVRQDGAAAVRGDSGDLPLVKQCALFVKIGDLDGGAAQIDAKTVFHVCFLP